MSEPNEFRGPPADEILERLIAGELAPTDPEARAALAADPTLNARWQEMTAMIDTLEAEGELRREIDAAAETMESAPGEAAVGAWVLARAREAREARRGRRRRLFASAAAAALALVAGWAVLRNGDPAEVPRDDRTLSGTWADLAPEGAVEVYTPFQWRAVGVGPGSGAEYRVSIFAAGAEKDALVTSEWQEATSWVPPEGTDELPDAIRWRVELRQTGYEETASDWIDARIDRTAR